MQLDVPFAHFFTYGPSTGIDSYISIDLVMRIRISLNLAYISAAFEILLFSVLRFFHENFHLCDQIKNGN